MEQERGKDGRGHNRGGGERKSRGNNSGIKKNSLTSVRERGKREAQ